MTAFYMTRLLIMTFFGTEKFDEHTRSHLHESPNSMTIPLVVLALLSAVGGWIGWPEFLGGSNHFHHFTKAVFPLGSEGHLPHIYEFILTGASLVIAFVGIGTAVVFYSLKSDVPGRLANRFPRSYRFAYNKYYVDEAYDATFVKGTIFLSKALGLFDKYVMDGLVNGSGWLLRGIVYVDGIIDRFIVDGAVNALADLVIGIGKNIRKMQTGRVYNYLLVMLTGFLTIVVSLYYFLK